MKAVILAGGAGTRMGHETAEQPKPLVEVGGRPIIWHIMKLYQAHGISDFIVCAGYLGHMLTEHFAAERGESWRVDVVDTGQATATAGRLRRIRDLVADETFCMTYGDGVSDLDITRLIAFHREQGKLVTVTAVEPHMPFGVLTFSGAGGVVGFQEKPQLRDIWVNSGFFVIEPRALDYIDGDDQPWEEAPMNRLAREGQLVAFRHTGFWQCMDTPRDREMLDERLRKGQAPREG